MPETPITPTGANAPTAKDGPTAKAELSRPDEPFTRGKPIPGRTTAAAEGDLVVFLIGMRINHFRAPHHWLRVLVAMPRMLRELRRRPDSGLLGYQLLTGSPRTYYVVQYWASKEQLLRYASDLTGLHRPAWTMVNRYARKKALHVGIWHETYVVPAGNYESIYGDMPPYGLGAATGVRPLREGVGAQSRLDGHR
ncbi:DUF4188 domain-containing protein [Streptomyces sp. PTM05]|uniref:DUF4188 domain-containing protein n=1 Tax=Streptantibioticus parmotrematis TaxID=2873249 RepID=A0ABS7R1M1_9ACTN|nr:DUF4188 domain-containing protein [Streptantibioticus parmotrematis]MBY8888829.1 DUF4188 domain-containing protein [Streptantibioticus parmotrematis]